MSKEWMHRALEESRARGFLGPQPIEPQIVHADGFAATWESHRETSPVKMLDLGSGGGLPGLVLMERWRCASVFLDSMIKRAAFIKEVLAWEEAPENGEVITARAEDAARWDHMNESFDLVTARSFGPASMTAECAVRFLKIGGVLIVSEPPVERDEVRWNSSGLGQLGLRALGRSTFSASYESLVKERPTPAEFPRASGTPKKRPLF